VFSKQDDSIGVCIKIPNRVIPVIFVPGVMGTNLMQKKPTQDEVSVPIWVMNDSSKLDGLLIAKNWGPKDAKERKILLNPQTTEVYDGGTLPSGAAPGFIHTGATQTEKDAELRRRGWGEVAEKSYGKWLTWLETQLNNPEYYRTGVPPELLRHLVACPPGVEPLTKAEGSLAYRYQFPVHVVGYNWLQSNADSANRLQKKIIEFMNYYNTKINGHTCEKVILVTHSMGGLVARYYTEVLKQSDKVLGVVHGVMPDIGSATAYKRVKAGTEGDGVVGTITSYVLGHNAAEMTAVFAQSPGPLQLLPSPAYGNGWLKIKDGKHYEALPIKGDPYGEIYTVRSKWWGLIDDKLINPMDKKKLTIDKDWRAFVDLMNDDVKKFHNNIANHYHPNTYAFYGDDKAHKTWGEVVWQRISSPALLIPQKSFDSLDNASDSALNFDSGQGYIELRGKSDGRQIQASFEIGKANENGDGTVPAHSGRAPQGRSGVKLCIGYPGVDHEGAYKKEPQRLFALWALTKVLQNVKGTPLDYPSATECKA